MTSRPRTTRGAGPGDAPSGRSGPPDDVARRRRPWWARPALVLAGLLVAYYALPVDTDRSPVALGLSMAAVVLGVAVIGWAMVTELVRLRHGEESRTAGALAMLLLLLVVGFSLTFYLLERASPGQVAELHTRTDALYFTLATMATVGYGDVHAEGQAARALVCVVITFNVVVVASLVRGYTARRSADASR